jgi:hypothetical protein
MYYAFNMNKKRSFLAISVSEQTHSALKVYCAGHRKMMSKEADKAVWDHLVALGVVASRDRSSGDAAGVAASGLEAGSENPGAGDGQTPAGTAGDWPMPSTPPGDEAPESPDAGEIF